MILEHIDSPADLRTLTPEELATLSAEIREFIVEAVTATGGHLGSNLGVVELTLALHRTFDSPRDVLLWDTGHQAYVHKLVTGRRDVVPQPAPGRRAVRLSQPDRVRARLGGEQPRLDHPRATPTGWPAPSSSKGSQRRVVAVVGDGALTGGMAYEALNNLGHSGKPVVIVLNDNGRSYAPTVSRLSLSLTHLRLNPAYIQARQRIRHLIRELPGVGDLAYSGVHGLTSALREVVTPHTFFEALGIRYAGPDRRARHRRRGAGPGQRLGVARAHRGPRAHPEGPGLRPGRGRRRPAAARRQGERAGRRCRRRSGAPCPRPRWPGTTGSSAAGGRRRRRGRRAAGHHLHRCLHPVPAPPRRGRPPDRGHHRGHARARPGSCRSRPASPTGSSTSASPSSTR